MPELPEVETIKRDLEKIILGRKFTKVCVRNPAVIREPTVAKFKQGVSGARVKRVLRKAKLLIIELSNHRALTIHLKMTGQLVYPGGGKNCRVAFYLSGGRILDFNDQRLFGELRLVKHWESLKFVQGLGPEPFDLTLEEFKYMLLKKQTKIKSLLLDQGFISGIGNIYAAEILFGARINPLRPAKSLSDKEKGLLFKAMRNILKDAIKHGGSSVDDYVRLSGKNGNYSRYHRVYNRENKPCFICGALIKRIDQGGRGTYYCPKCQM